MEQDKEETLGLSALEPEEPGTLDLAEEEELSDDELSDPGFSVPDPIPGK